MEYFRISEIRIFGFLEFRNFGISEFRNFGISEFRKFGISEVRNFGILEFRNFGISEFRIIGLSEFRNFGNYEIFQCKSIKIVFTRILTRAWRLIIFSLVSLSHTRSKRGSNYFTSSWVLQLVFEKIAASFFVVA